jgi:eukaryotic-like serine/threonine-protein kinase
MNREQFRRQHREIVKILALPEAEQAAYLIELESTDAEFHAQILSLLQHRETPPSIIESGPLTGELGEGLTGALADLHHHTPEQIGPYQILEVLGEGGMGVVYRAEQTAPIRRQVAIKVIKLGMDTRSIVARFQGESQALALMNHPHIATVYDAGVDERGRPYFVMELAEGVPVTQWCDAQTASLDTRLDLFLTLCDAVQHAHQKGVIHRDLKPGNLLVCERDGTPFPTVIDFGIAKALDDAPDVGGMTLAGQLMGTPDYMSPEQLGEVEGGADTRTDVYALGRVLQELLAGAGSGSTQSGDLGNIVQMAVRENPERRYSSVDQFSDDIKHYRRGEPVVATADSLGYRIGRFVNRNRTSVGLMATALALLLGFTTTVAVQGERVRRERNRAVEAEQTATLEAETTSEVAGFLVDLFSLADPARTRGEVMTARAMVDSGAVRIRSELSDRPIIQGRIMETLGDLYLKLGAHARAETLLTETLSVRQAALGADHVDIARTLEHLGTLAHDQGQYELAVERIGQSLAMLRRLGLEDTALTAFVTNSLAVSLEGLGRYEEAAPLYEAALAKNRELLGEEDPEVCWGLNTMGQIRWRQGEYLTAQTYFEDAVRLARRLYGDIHPDLCAALNNLGGCLILNGDYERAERILREAMEDYRALYGEDHAGVGRADINWAGVLDKLGRREEALAVFERGNAIQWRVLGAEHPYYARGLARLGLAHAQAGDGERGVAEIRRALRITAESMGSGHPSMAVQSLYLAEALLLVGRLDEAESIARAALEIRTGRLSHEHPLVAEAQLILAEIFAAQGDADRARTWTGDAVDILRTTLGENHAATRLAAARLR